MERGGILPLTVLGYRPLDIENKPGSLSVCLMLKEILEDTARYAGLLPTPAKGFGLRPRLFLPFGQKKTLLCCFGPFLAFFGVQ